MSTLPRRARPARPACHACRAGAAVIALALTAVTIAACGSPPRSPRTPVPAEFRAACGHPGARVTVRKVPVTIPHAGCDLTGVVITYPGYGGATVPRGSTSVGTSSGFSVTVQPVTLDVTVSVSGPPGNA